MSICTFLSCCCISFMLFHFTFWAFWMSWNYIISWHGPFNVHSTVCWHPHPHPQVPFNFSTFYLIIGMSKDAVATGYFKCKRWTNKQLIKVIERLSIECRKTKTKVITLANQKGGRQSGKPIKIRSNTRSRYKARENVHAPATIGFGFTSDWLKKWCKNFEPITEWSNHKPK